METCSWTSFFVTPKCFDYVELYMMLLEQAGHKLVKILVIATWLNEERIHFPLSTWLDYSLAFTWNSSCLPFSILSIFAAVYLTMARDWVRAKKTRWEIWEFCRWGCSRILISFSRELPTHKISSCCTKNWHRIVWNSESFVECERPSNLLRDGTVE